MVFFMAEGIFTGILAASATGGDTTGSATGGVADTAAYGIRTAVGAARDRWGYHWGGEHRWGYHWGGYRRVTEVGAGVVEAPRVVETPRCPEGTHLGYRGKYCWPNRQ